MRTKRRKRSLVGVLLLAGAVAAAAFTFTASNTVPASNAGSGSTAISGYTVADIQYNVNSSNPQNLDSVQFTLSPAGYRDVRVRLSATGSWYNTCDESVSPIVCTTSGETVAGATELTVVAVQ